MFRSPFEQGADAALSAASRPALSDVESDVHTSDLNVARELASAASASSVHDPTVNATPSKGDPMALLPWMDGPSPEDLIPEGSSVADAWSGPVLADSGAAVPRGARYDPRWTGIAHGPIDEAWAPSAVRIPDAVSTGLDEAWQQTVTDPRHREHGGNIVRTYGGRYEMHQGGPGLETLYDGDESDIGRLQDHVGIVHTHPYFKEKSDHAGFSGGDFTNMTSHNVPLSLLRSGSNTTYMLARTKQFQHQLDAIEKTYDGNGEALEEKRRAFSAGMEGTYDAAFEAALKQNKGDFPAAVEAAGVAVATKYHLLYYKGTGANLHRIGGGPPVRSQ